MAKFAFYVFVTSMFLLSNNLLTVMGIPYSSDGGGIFAIHPSTFAVVVCLVSLIFLGKRRSESDPTVYALPSVLVSLALVQTTILGRDGTGDLSVLIVTYLQPAILLMVLQFAERDASAWRFCRCFVSLFFLCNSSIAIAEYLTGWRLLPYYAGSVLVYTDTRPTAILGHPLPSAALTGVLVILLVARAVESGLKPSLLFQIALHSTAMLSFSSRAATALMIVFLVALLGKRLGLSKRIKTFTAINAGLMLYFAALAGPAILALGFGDQVIERFYSAASSTQARFSALDLLQLMSSEQWLLGADLGQRVDAMRILQTEYGIEIAPIALMFRFGIFIALMVMVPVVVYLLRAYSGKVPGRLSAVLFFLAVSMTSFSIGSKSLLISQVLIIFFAYRTSATSQGDKNAIENPSDPNTRFHILA